ncbi:MAG: synthase subunit epsilon [Bacillales bacterium]|jgi:F-type H+-transporting ATPase subunit epsilon|nr:synthase subunit epsilon [Bacillales bacterium]
MKKFHLSVVTPDGPVVDGEYEIIVAQTESGKIGILANHIPLVAPLMIGSVSIKNEEKKQWLAVSSGFIEVSGKNVSVLVQSAELADSIDLARAEAARKRAEARVQAKTSDIDIARANLALQRAINRINVVNQHL